MAAKPFDLTDLRRRVKLASGNELLALTEEVLARNEDRMPVAECHATQTMTAVQGPNDDRSFPDRNAKG